MATGHNKLFWLRKKMICASNTKAVFYPVKWHAFLLSRLNSWSHQGPIRCGNHKITGHSRGNSIGQKSGILHRRGCKTCLTELKRRLRTRKDFLEWKMLWFVGESLYLDLSDIQEIMRDTQEFTPGKFFSRVAATPNIFESCCWIHARHFAVSMLSCRTNVRCPALFTGLQSLNSLMTGVYKCLNRLSPVIMNDVLIVSTHAYNSQYYNLLVTDGAKKFDSI